MVSYTVLFSTGDALPKHSAIRQTTRPHKQRGQAMARPAAGNCWAESILSEASGHNHLGRNPCQQSMLHDKICKKPTTRPVRGRDLLGWSARLRNRRNLASNTEAQRRKVWWSWATPLDRFVTFAQNHKPQTRIFDESPPTKPDIAGLDRALA